MLIKAWVYRYKKGIGILHMSQEMSNFKVQNKKTHYTNASAQSYKISVRDKHIFQEKWLWNRNVYHYGGDQGYKNERADALRAQEQVQQQVLSAAGVPASVGMSLFHDPQSF